VAGTATEPLSAVSLIAALHRAHEARLDRVAAVRRARVAFLTPQFGAERAEALVGRCHGQVVGLWERPDLIVVRSTRHIPSAPAASPAARVVDTAEFLAMHQAVVDAAGVSMLRLAVRGARLRLAEAVRLGVRSRPAPTPVDLRAGDGRSRMRTGAEPAGGPRHDPAHDAVAEAFARRVRDRRAADLEARRRGG
jgi:hypothetical protein